MSNPELHAALPPLDLAQHSSLGLGVGDYNSPVTAVSQSMSSPLSTLLGVDPLVTSTQPSDPFDLSSDFFLPLPEPSGSSNASPTTTTDLTLLGAPPSPSVHDTLKKVLQLPSRASWIRDFLFADAPAIDLAMLSAPASLEAAICATASESWMELSGAHNRMLDANLSIAWSLIPSFCTGDLVCGAACVSVELTNPTGNNAQRELCFGRWVRDERTSEFVMYRSHPAQDGKPPSCSLLHLMLPNSTSRERRFIRFGVPTSGCIPDAATAVFMNVSHESRLCPACNSGPSANCSCVLFGRSPAHPLDYNDCTVMANHCGEYSGHTVSSVFSGPGAPIVAHMISRAEVRGDRNRDLTNTLTAWAVRNKLTALGPDANTVKHSSLTPDEEKVLNECISGKRTLKCGKPTCLQQKGAVTAQLAPFAAYMQGGHLGTTLPKMTLPLPPLSVGSGGGSSSGSNSEEEKAKRKHQRKLRNRMAAARSNMKRKATYETLVRNVTEIREKKQVLTSRLDRLRRENQRLKELMAL